MILEVAILQVIEGHEQQFEIDFLNAVQFLMTIEGYISYSLKKCFEQKNKYILLVEWATLESHTIGFRQSTNYEVWKMRLHHYYHPFPTVEHYEDVVFDKHDS